MSRRLCVVIGLFFGIRVKGWTFLGVIATRGVDDLSHD